MSNYYCAVWQRWLLYKMLIIIIIIISYVEICSKPMAILLYDDFWYVCFLPCLLWLVIVDSWRDIIFLWWFVCYLCGQIKVTSVLAEGANVKGECGKKDGDEEETRRLRRCWMVEKESRQGGKEGERGGALFTWKPPSVTGLFLSSQALELMESRPLKSASNIISKAGIVTH